MKPDLVLREQQIRLLQAQLDSAHTTIRELRAQVGCSTEIAQTYGFLRYHEGGAGPCVFVSIVQLFYAQRWDILVQPRRSCLNLKI